MGKTYKYNRRGKVKAAGEGQLSKEERAYTGGRVSYSSGERHEQRRSLRHERRALKESGLTCVLEDED
jgi:hypothetical protein